MALQITSPAGPSKVSVSAKNAFSTSHIVAATAGTEYTIAILSGTKSYSIQSEDNSKLTVSSLPGGTATDDSWVIWPGNSWDQELLVGSALNVYVKSSKNSTKIKVITWT
jgi:hypothetical protein